MAKNINVKNSKKKNTPKTTNRKPKEFTSPNETWWGQAIIWVLIFGTVLLVIISLIVAIIANF